MSAPPHTPFRPIPFPYISRSCKPVSTFKRRAHLPCRHLRASPHPCQLNFPCSMQRISRPKRAVFRPAIALSPKPSAPSEVICRRLCLRIAPWTRPGTGFLVSFVGQGLVGMSGAGLIFVGARWTNGLRGDDVVDLTVYLGYALTLGVCFCSS
jgi:hypothetical protein